MERKYIKDLTKYVGQEATIAGFAQTIRDQNKIVFILVRDITGIVQVVVHNQSGVLEIAKALTTESVISVKGTVKEEPQAPGGFEIAASNMRVLSISNSQLPIPVIEEKGADKTHTDTRFDYRWLDLRRPEKAEVFKVWTELEKGFRKYWYENNFVQIYTPSFMATASESGAEVFKVKYFERTAYLAQSPQFYKQMGIASGLERVFMVGPIFRAEPSFTTRHMTEFTGWDFEIGYIESHHDVMDHEEQMIVSGFECLKTALPKLEIEVPTRPFPRISIAEVKEKLKSAGIESEHPHDLSPAEERAIADILKRETGHDFVFITDYHISKRPFYHMRHADKPEITKSADLLYRGLEITTLAQREHRPEILESQAIEKGMNLEELRDYLNFFKYGCPPHGGGGIGPGRIVMKILDLPSVKDATFLPRDVNRLTP